MLEKRKTEFDEVWLELCFREHWLSVFLRNLVSTYRLRERLAFDEASQLLQSARFIEELRIARRLFRQHPDLVTAARPEQTGGAAGCPEQSDLENYVLGTVAPADGKTVATHLIGCHACRGRLERIRGFLDTARWTILAEECRKLGIRVDESAAVRRLSCTSTCLEDGAVVIVQWGEPERLRESCVGTVEQASRTALILRGNDFPEEGTNVLLLGPRLNHSGVVRFLDKSVVPERVAVFLG